MEDVKKKIDGMAVWSLFGLLTTIFLVTIFIKANYSLILANITLLITGNADQIATGSELGLIAKVAEVLAVILLAISAAILTALVFNRSTKSFDREAIEKALEKGPWLIFAVVAAEELFARGLFLGVLWSIFPGKAAFYILFFLGNGIWAILHLTNIKSTEDRSILKVLPQFVGGIAFTYIFLRFGIFVAILAHFYYDVVVMTSMKKKDSLAVNIVNGAYYLIATGVLSVIAWATGAHLSSLAPWLNGQIVPLDGYGFFGYALILMIVNCIVSVIINALLLDPTDDKKGSLKKIADTGGIGFVLIISLAGIVLVAMILFGNWILSLFIANIVTRAVILSIGLGLMTNSSSGSAMARTTLVNLPITFLLVAAFSVLGFWTAFGIATVNLLVDFIPNLLDTNA